MSEIKEGIEAVAHDLTSKIYGQMDANLFESIISLFNSGVLVHYVRNPRTRLDTDNFKMTVDAANGVRFKGREKIIEQEKEIQQLKAKNKVLMEAVEFYDGVHRLNWAIDLSMPAKKAKEALRKCEEIDNE